MSKTRNYHVTENGKTVHLSRNEFVQYLINGGNWQRFQNAPKRFKKTFEGKLPAIYKTEAGYVKAIVE